jgi:23S rRNA pseudouridine1911/1915/1917 synthase
LYSTGFLDNKGLAMKIKLELKTVVPNTRLDQAILGCLKEQHPDFSRNLLKTQFQNQKVCLSGQPVKASLLLKPGTYTVELEDFEAPHAKARKPSPSVHPGGNLSIVFENSELLVLNKPTGIPSVPQDSTETETAVGLALAHDPNLQNVEGHQSLELGLLHRLDTGTSGLLVFAKTQKEFERLKQLWKNGKVEKTYRAWVSLEASPNSEVIQFPLPLPYKLDTPLAHDGKSSKRMRTYSSTSRSKIRGKPLAAVTHLLSIKHRLENLFDLEIQIETGVMHQIRCHLASEGLPILGDDLYSESPSTRLWLHASRLGLTTQDNQILDLEAPLPEGWLNPPRNKIKSDKK